MNFSVFHSILESVWRCVWQLKLGWNCVMQQDNDPKHSSKSTTERPKKKRIKVLQWSSQSLDINLAEIMWWNLNRAVHKQTKTSVNWSSNVRNWSRHTQNNSFELLLLQVVLQAVKSWGVLSVYKPPLYVVLLSVEWIMTLCNMPYVCLFIWACIYLILRPGIDHVTFSSYYILICKTLRWQRV